MVGSLAKYANVDAAKLRSNLIYLLKQVIPVADEIGAKRSNILMTRRMQYWSFQGL
jgi:D-mannonate dehydratase